MAYVLGLTGGIASGKSTVADILRSQGAFIIDADQVARQVVAPETLGLQRVISVFGRSYLQADGSLDRKKLGAYVFANKKALEQLNMLLQSLIQAEILQQLQAAQERDERLIVLEIPLLFEYHYEKYCDAVLVVNVPYEVQCERLMQRDDISLAAAQNKIAQQMSAEKRVALADKVIDNTSSLENMKTQVLKYLKNII
ncbi:dephospho-CoA kinase [Ligilactobacillus ceti]|uniref:Dephospho-CoA kinase n=1 Tax=Ligilactobacillus ceti DSM 22408 TaxID=1122146 RepID=A0A0R2KMY9_9LACO|nr:dephospho-CoA kinase [Ligilactobacillus ceti]KRN88524.1 dephospho-CoA kinase [Ligilactobacillus ceti DSM 22408]